MTTTYASDQAELRQRLRRMRRRHGLTQLQAATAACMSRLQYNRLETGNLIIKPAHLEALSKLYDEEIRP